MKSRVMLINLKKHQERIEGKQRRIFSFSFSKKKKKKEKENKQWM